MAGSRADGCYHQPVGRLRLTVVDALTGRATPARVSITAADGRSFAPDNAWRHADDGFDRKQRGFKYGYFHSRGSSVVSAPAGELEVEVSRGPEYRVVRRTVTLRPDSTTPLRIALTRLADLVSTGWFSADLHVHMNYGGAYRNTPARLALQARAEDLHLVENLIVNKEGRVPDGRLLYRPPRSGVYRLDAHRPRPGVPHQRVGPHWTVGADQPPHSAGLRRLREHCRSQSRSHQRRRVRPGSRAEGPHRLRPSFRRRSRSR